MGTYTDLLKSEVKPGETKTEQTESKSPPTAPLQPQRKTLNKSQKPVLSEETKIPSSSSPSNQVVRPTQSTTPPDQPSRPVESTNQLSQDSQPTQSTGQSVQLMGKIIDRPSAFYIPVAINEEIEQAVAYYQKKYNKKIDRSAIVAAFLGNSADWTPEALDSRVNYVLDQLKNRFSERLANQLT